MSMGRWRRTTGRGSGIAGFESFVTLATDQERLVEHVDLGELIKIQVGKGPLGTGAIGGNANREGHWFVGNELNAHHKNHHGGAVSVEYRLSYVN